MAKSVVLDAAAVSRAVRRMAHEIIEANKGLDDVVLIGLQTGGVPFAEAIAAALVEIESVEVPVGKLDVAFYRDDINLRPVLPEAVTEIDFDLSRKVVVLVDDVLFTGRTIRAALDAIIDQGRPRAIQLAVMVDRGHRELPIRPDYVGKNLPTRRNEAVNATLEPGRARGGGAVKHLLTIEGLEAAPTSSSCSTWHGLLRRGPGRQRDIPKVPALRGKTVVLAFFEDSTRTRTSFDLAARRLSADVVNFSVGSSSATKKGESLRDTVETIAAMGVDAIVVRHASSGCPGTGSPGGPTPRWSTPATAGTSTRPRPSSTATPSASASGRLEGRKVAICGDIKHSRVARSNVQAFTRLGAEVVLIGPRTLLPPSLEGWPVKVEPDLDAVLPDLDVIYLLRIQHERLGEALFPSNREYRARYGLTVERAARLDPRRPDHAPRADEPGRRDRPRGGRRPPLGRARPGRGRGPGPHGRAVPPARPRTVRPGRRSLGRNPPTRPQDDARLGQAPEPTVPTRTREELHDHDRNQGWNRGRRARRAPRRRRRRRRAGTDHRPGPGRCRRRPDARRRGML